MANQLAPALTTHDGSAARDQLAVVRPLYAEIYAEPPHNEGPDDVTEFADEFWPWYIERPGFRLVVAELDAEPVGFTFGFTVDASWWTELLDPVDPAITEEWDGRTFGIIELAVRAQYRRQGIGRALVDALLSDRAEKRQTLCVRPESESVVSTYRRWGFEVISRKQPGPNRPIYLQMIRNSRG